MDNNANTLHNKVHQWIDSVGFSFNGSQTNTESKVTTNHYFFETFDFFENAIGNDTENAKFLCFDAYGERVKVKTLLDLQSAFYENISAS